MCFPRSGVPFDPYLNSLLHVPPPFSLYLLSLRDRFVFLPWNIQGPIIVQPFPMYACPWFHPGSQPSPFLLSYALSGVPWIFVPRRPVLVEDQLAVDVGSDAVGAERMFS